MRAKMIRQRLGDACNADVPGDVAHQLALRQPEIAERARDQPSVMVAGEEKRRASRGIIFVDRRNFVAVQQ